MQLRLPWDARPAARRPSPVRQLVVSGESLDVEIVRHHLARRYVVRVTDDGVVKLTVPRGASIAGGLRFAERSAAWIARERQRLQERAAPWQTGQPIWFRGEVLPLGITGRVARLGDQAIKVDADGRNLRDALQAHLRDIATAELPARCAALAKQVGLSVSRVSVRNQRSRWGACSAERVITLNWRLIQMPPSVSDYVIFHELMHIKQPNHSRRFWREVNGVCPGWREAERWLRKYGKEIL